jgi:hypothetical protein
MVHKSKPKVGDRVRHIRTRDTGKLRGYDSRTGFVSWALVAWDVAGPGMVRDEDGLAMIAPNLLECVDGRR